MPSLLTSVDSRQIAKTIYNNKSKENDIASSNFAFDCVTRLKVVVNTIGI